MSNYLDYNGLLYFWGKIKAAISAHTATVTQTVTSGTELAEVDGTKIYAPAAGGGKVVAGTLTEIALNYWAAFDANGYATASWQNVMLRITADSKTYDVEALAYVTYNKNTQRLNARIHDFVGHQYASNKGYTLQPASARSATGRFTIQGIPTTDAATFENGALVLKTALAAASQITTVPSFDVLITEQSTT